MLSNQVGITTFDNPYDPFEQFTQWMMFDCEKGYNTCNYLARTALLTDDMTQKEEDDEVERAIDVIIEHDFLNIYKKVKRSSNNNVDANDK